MATIKEMIARVSVVEKNIDSYLLEQVNNEEDFVLDLNRDQLGLGLDSGNNSITPPYTPFTKQIKRIKQQPTDRVTLKDTGDFYRSFFLVFGDDYFELDAKDKKVDELELKYGDDILGLTSDNVGVVAEKIKEPFLDVLAEVILR